MQDYFFFLTLHSAADERFIIPSWTCDQSEKCSASMRNIWRVRVSASLYCSLICPPFLAFHCIELVVFSLTLRLILSYQPTHPSPRYPPAGVFFSRLTSLIENCSSWLINHFPIKILSHRESGTMFIKPAYSANCNIAISHTRPCKLFNSSCIAQSQGAVSYIGVCPHTAHSFLGKDSKSIWERFIYVAEKSV